MLTNAEYNEKLFEYIQAVLMSDWDPICIKDVPECYDEYDSYIPAAMYLFKNEFIMLDSYFQMPMSDIDKKNQLVDYLCYIEKEHMFCKPDLDKNRKVANKIFMFGLNA